MKKIVLHIVVSAVVALMLLGTGRLFAEKAKPLEVGITEHLDSIVPADIMLTDQNGNLVNLKQLIKKPTVLCFVYYKCPGICSPLMNGLAEVIGETGLVLGKDYQAITISFDCRETYELGQKKRLNYLKHIKGQDGNGWAFLTGDSANIARATKAIGFGFKKVNGEFIHEGSLIMISPEGKITRYLKGISFQPFEFKLAMLEASKGKSAPTLINVLSFCYTYDRKAEHYSLDITRITATFTLILALTLLIYLLVKGRKKKTVNA